MTRTFGLWLVLGLIPALGQAGPVPEPAPAKCPAPAWFRSSPAVLDEDFPPPPAGDRGFDVISYDLDIRLDPSGSTIAGSVAVGLTALDDPLTTIQLDLVEELTCTEVRSGAQALTFQHTGDALFIDLPSPLAAAASETVTVHWQGRPPRHGQMLVGLLFRHHNAGTLDDPADDVPIIANLSEPWSAHSWWPCKDHPADKALVSLAVTVPDTLSAVSNGTLLGSEQVEPGWRRYRWREQYPLATYLVSVAASNYVMWQEDCLAGGTTVPLQYFVFPQDVQKAEVDFAPTCDMLGFMTDLAGYYPFAGEKYAQVEIKWTGAMEHTTATSISQMLLTGDGRFETLILHELAHHWFGNSLTPGAWRDIWLNEGFARYCEALWVEHSRGRPAYNDFMAGIGLQRHPDFFGEQGLLGDPAPILPNILIYDKGAWLLHSLRQFLGDQAFFAFLHDYANRPDLVQGTVLLQDMIAVAESHAGRSLEGFFNPWLETAEVPRLWWETTPLPTGVRLDFHQLQDTVFEMAVPVRLDTGCGSVERTARLTRRHQSVVWTASCPVEQVQVDPDSLVFMLRGQEPPPPLTVQGPFPNPLGDRGADLKLFLTEDAQVFVRIYDVRGRKMKEYDLGPLAATGPARDQASVPHTWQFHPTALGPAPGSGVYWLEFQAGQARAVRKFTLLR